jgi:hypothetical protein
MLLKEVLKSIFQRRENVLGRAVFAAKCSLITWYPSDDNFYGPAVLWTLFGDPALRARHGSLTSVEAPQPGPRATDHLDIAPNPARGSVGIHCSLAALARVALSLHNEVGALVRSVDLGWLEAGSHCASLDCSDLPAGVYFLQATIRPAQGVRPYPLRRKLCLN